jgi:transposase
MTRELLSDEIWAKIEAMLPGKASDSGVTAADNRRVIEAVLWIARTGAPWRDLPAELGNWHTTYTRFNRWCKRGRWLAIMSVFGVDRDLEALMIDSTVVRAHQHAAGAQKKQAIKRLDAPGVG